MMQHFHRGRTASLLAAVGWMFAGIPVAPAAENETRWRLMLTVLGPEKQPAADVAVSVSHEGLSVDAELTTDSQGMANITYPATVTRLQVTVDGGDGTVPMRLLWGYENRPHTIPDRYALTLDKGIRVDGMVLDDGGSPIAGATVVLSASAVYPEHPERSTAISYKKLKTNEDGHWSYHGLPENPTRLSLGVYDHRYASTFGNDSGAYSMKTHTNLEALRQQAGKLTLKRGPLIEGVVTGSDGKPLAGASVGIGKDRIASNILPSVKTDAEGRFVIATHPKEMVTVTVRAKDHAPELEHVTMPAEGREPLKIQMKPAQTLTGRVIDPDGRPVARAYVWIDTWREARTIRTDLRTDADGRFVWNGAPTDTVMADFQADGFARSRDVQLKAGEANEVKLLKRVAIRLEVVDAATGKPVPKFQVIPGIVWRPNQPVSWQRETDQMKWMGKEGHFETTYDFPYPGHVMRIEADGYAAAQTATFTIAEGDRTFKVGMNAGASLTGRVLGPDGQPLSGMEVMMVTPKQRVTFENATLGESDRRQASVMKTAADGRFSFPPPSEVVVLCASAPAGYAELEVPAPGGKDSPKGPVDLQLQPWGRIEGVVMIGTKPAANAVVQGYSPRHHQRDKPELNHDFNVDADGDGRFVIEHVRPGPFIVGRRQSLGERTWSAVSQQHVLVKPGETVRLRIGGKGRPVMGKLDLPKELLPGGRPWEAFNANIATVVDYSSIGKPPMPEEVKADPSKARAWYENWQTNTDAGRTFIAKLQALQQTRRSDQVKVNPQDGTFRVDDVLPGDYTFSAALNKPSGRFDPAGRIATAGLKFTVPEVPGGVSDEPLELPLVPVTVIRDIKVGDSAPLWEAKTVEGKPLKLSDFRGRYVLLDFWATWCGPCVAETPNLKRVHDAFGGDKRFAMVALSLDADVKEPKAYAEKNQLGWIQGHLGDWSTTGVPASYGVEGIPSIWLIGPDGKVVAKDVRGGGIEEAVRKALQ